MRRSARRLLLPLLLAGAVAHADAAVEVEDTPFAMPDTLLFGDTHLHTALSFDAGLTGTRLMPRDGYRFARGETVTSNTGQQARLARPLDFLVVADHSDYLGFAPDLRRGSTDILARPEGRRWHRMLKDKHYGALLQELLAAFRSGKVPEEFYYSPGHPGFDSTWEQIVDAADNANDPGVFTALVGYEWTSTPGGGNNLHRNVIYREGGATAKSRAPFTTLRGAGSEDPRELWQWMAQYERETGGQVLAIPHNGNLSNGLMFPGSSALGRGEIDAEYARLRARWEPLFEVTQIKGDSETHPLLSPNDELADFERWDTGNLTLTAAKQSSMLRHEYARSGLRLGLELARELGVNPYRFGLIGSTDSHVGISAVEEGRFFGKSALAEPGPERWRHPYMRNEKTGLEILNWQTISSGYAAVWATANTREAIFAALERREVYATTGSRMRVRLFGGWDFDRADARRPELARIGYERGVPMGGELRAAPEGRAPRFLVSALKDPEGAGLARIQIIKGWVNTDGSSSERVFDVARPATSERHAAGSEMAADTAEDASALSALWVDPAFNPEQAAFYYARVIEVPALRWTGYDTACYGVEMADEVPQSSAERAYTSPIWYIPAEQVNN